MVSKISPGINKLSHPWDKTSYAIINPNFIAEKIQNSYSAVVHLQARCVVAAAGDGGDGDDGDERRSKNCPHALQLKLRS